MLAWGTAKESAARQRLNRVCESFTYTTSILLEECFFSTRLIKKTMLCKSVFLDEKLYSFHAHNRILQIDNPCDL